MKKLASILKITNKYSHKLQDLWDEILKHPKIRAEETIVTEGLLVLAEYDVLQDEELFRYEQRNKSSMQLLKNYPAISQECFYLLAKAYQALDSAILELIHESKFGASSAFANE